MIYKNQGFILLISKDREVKNFFRNLLQAKKFKDLHLVICSKPLKNTQRAYTKIIFLDITQLDSSIINKILKMLRRNYMATPIFIISDEENETYYPIEQLLNYGIHLIMQKPLKRITLESIFYKYIRSLKDQNFDFKKYNGLILNEKFQYAIYNNCKIFLSETECLLISILIEEGCILKSSEIKNILEEKQGKKLSKASVRICIHRIRRKFKDTTGINLIGNKYGRGYYLSI
jgi:DNA-binding response OmpR family regulator